MKQTYKIVKLGLYTRVTPLPAHWLQEIEGKLGHKIESVKILVKNDHLIIKPDTENLK